MTTKLRSVEDVARKQKQEAELAVFWDTMASALPKSIERSALGDEKIFTAFAATYPQIKSHIAAVLIEGLEGKRRPETWTVMTTPVVSNENIAFNQALDTAITLIRTTLNVTSEEK